MALCQTSVLKLYHAVIEDVIASVRDAFLDEGVDEQVLQEMKQIWRTKLMASKAVEINPEPTETLPPQIVLNNPKPSKAASAKAKKAAAAAAAAAAQQGNATSTGADIRASGTALPTSISIANATTAASSVGNGPSTSAISNASSSATLPNGLMKQEHPQNPPPLHSTQQQSQQLHQSKSSNMVHGATIAQHTGQQQSSAAAIPAVAALDPNKIMPVNITLPAQPSQPGSLNSESRVLTIHVPASALQENQLTQILTAHLISSIMSLPTTLASSVLQQHVNAALVNANMQIHQNN